MEDLKKKYKNSGGSSITKQRPPEIVMEFLKESDKYDGTTVHEGLFRNNVYRMLVKYAEDYRTYGEMIIALDDTNYWRNVIFPNYKAIRKQREGKSDMDMAQIFGIMEIIKEDLKSNFPLKCVRASKCEADDVIAYYINMLRSEKNLIISADGDLKQLCYYENTYLLTPFAESPVTISQDEALQSLHEKIVRGDLKDSVPNIYSTDSFLIEQAKLEPSERKRQKSVTAKFLREFDIDNLDESIPEELSMIKNYRRNEKILNLIDLPKKVFDHIDKVVKSTEIEGDYDKLKQHFDDKLITNKNHNAFKRSKLR